MLVLYDNGNDSKELRIFKVTAIKYENNTNISDPCTRGMHVYTKKNNTNTVKIPTNISEKLEPVEESEPVKIPTNTTKESETAVEKNVETLAIIGLIQQVIIQIVGKLNEIHKERNDSSTELTNIKSLDQQLLNTINKNKEKLDWV